MKNACFLFGLFLNERPGFGVLWILVGVLKMLVGVLKMLVGGNFKVILRLIMCCLNIQIELYVWSGLFLDVGWWII